MPKSPPMNFASDGPGSPSALARLALADAASQPRSPFPPTPVSGRRALRRPRSRHAHFSHRHRHRFRRRCRDHDGAVGAGRSGLRPDDCRRQCRARPGDAQRALYGAGLRRRPASLQGRRGAADAHARGCALVPRQGRTERPRLSRRQTPSGERACGRRDLAAVSRRTRPHPGHTWSAHQCRARLGARSRARSQRRALRGDGRRALLRGQCHTGGRIQHLGRSRSGAHGVPFRSADRNGRLASLARVERADRTGDRRHPRARHREGALRHRVQRPRQGGLFHPDRRGRPLPRRSDRDGGGAGPDDRERVEPPPRRNRMRQRIDARHDDRRPAQRGA